MIDSIICTVDLPLNVGRLRPSSTPSDRFLLRTDDCTISAPDLACPRTNCQLKNTRPMISPQEDPVCTYASHDWPASLRLRIVGIKGPLMYFSSVRSRHPTLSMPLESVSQGSNRFGVSAALFAIQSIFAHPRGLSYESIELFPAFTDMVRTLATSSKSNLPVPIDARAGRQAVPGFNASYHDIDGTSHGILHCFHDDQTSLAKSSTFH